MRVKHFKRSQFLSNPAAFPKNPQFELLTHPSCENCIICHFKNIETSLFGGHLTNKPFKIIQPSQLFLKLQVVWAVPQQKTSHFPWYERKHTPQTHPKKTKRLGSRSVPAGFILLMEEILHHLGCIKPCEWWDNLHPKWLAGFQPSTVSPPPPWDVNDVNMISQQRCQNLSPAMPNK